MFATWTSAVAAPGVSSHAPTGRVPCAARLPAQRAGPPSTANANPAPAAQDGRARGAFTTGRKKFAGASPIVGVAERRRGGRRWARDLDLGFRRRGE